MNNRYEFSVDSYPYLVKFLDAANKSKNTAENEKKTAWSNILPKNVDLLEKLRKWKTDDNVINISFDSISDNSAVDDPSHEAPIPSTSFNEEKFSAIVEKLKNQFSVEALFDNLDTLSETEIEGLMEYIGKLGLDVLTVYNFGCALVKNENSRRGIFVTYFCRHVLITMMNEGNSSYSTDMFLSILDNHPETLCSELAKNFVSGDREEYPRLLLYNLSKLELKYMQQVLGEFVLNCSKLRKEHFLIVSSLIVCQTDLGLLKKVFDLFSASSKEFSDDKSFGKLVYGVLQQIERNMHKFEPCIRTIVASLKTPWKGRILQMLEKNITQRANFSQLY